jgi:hypothetical protein
VIDVEAQPDGFSQLIQSVGETLDIIIFQARQKLRDPRDQRYRIIEAC